MTPFFGKMNDLDTHITPTPDVYESVAGPEAGKFYADMCRKTIETTPAEKQDTLPELMGHEAQVLNDDTVWNMKGSGAAGSYSSKGRLGVLDYMGVNKAFVFADPALMMGAFSDSELGLSAMRGWNDYSIDFRKTNPQRLLPVGMLNTHNIDVA